MYTEQILKLMLNTDDVDDAHTSREIHKDVNVATVMVITPSGTAKNFGIRDSMTSQDLTYLSPMRKHTPTYWATERLPSRRLDPGHASMLFAGLNCVRQHAWTRHHSRHFPSCGRSAEISAIARTAGKAQHLTVPGADGLQERPHVFPIPLRDRLINPG